MNGLECHIWDFMSTCGWLRTLLSRFGLRIRLSLVRARLPRAGARPTNLRVLFRVLPEVGARNAAKPRDEILIVPATSAELAAAIDSSSTATNICSAESLPRQHFWRPWPPDPRPRPCLFLLIRLVLTIRSGKSRRAARRLKNCVVLNSVIISFHFFLRKCRSSREHDCEAYFCSVLCSIELRRYSKASGTHRRRIPSVFFGRSSEQHRHLLQPALQPFSPISSSEAQGSRRARSPLLSQYRCKSRTGCAKTAVDWCSFTSTYPQLRQYPFQASSLSRLDRPEN